MYMIKHKDSLGYWDQGQHVWVDDHRDATMYTPEHRDETGLPLDGKWVTLEAIITPDDVIIEPSS